MIQGVGKGKDRGTIRQADRPLYKYLSSTKVPTLGTYCCTRTVLPRYSISKGRAVSSLAFSFLSHIARPW